MKTFKKLLAISSALDINKLKPSEAYTALLKQHILIKMQLKLVAMQSELDMFTSKTNYEFGLLSNHADRLLLLIEK